MRRAYYLIFLLLLGILLSSSCTKEEPELSNLTPRQKRLLEKELKDINEKLQKPPEEPLDKLEEISKKIKLNIRKSEVLYKLGKTKASEDLVKDLLSKHPHHPEVLMKKVFEQFAAGKKSAAIEILKELINSFPEYYPSYAVYGIILYQENQPKEAYSFLRKADELEGITINISEYKTSDSELEFTSVKLRRRFYFHKRKVKRMNNMDVYGNFDYNLFHYTLAKVYFNKKWYKSSRIQCRKILIFDNKDIETLLLISEDYQKLHQPERAIAILEYTTNLDETKENAYFSLCRMSYEVKDYIKAKGFLEIFIERFPESENIIQVKEMLADIYNEFSIFEKAETLYKDLIKENNKDDTILSLAKLYFKWGKRDKGVKLLKKLSKKKISGYKAQLILAELAIESDDYKMSWDILKKLKKINLEEPEAYHLLAQFYYRLFKEKKHEAFFNISRKDIRDYYFLKEPEQLPTPVNIKPNTLPEKIDDELSPFRDHPPKNEKEIEDERLKSEFSDQIIFDDNLILDLAIIEERNAIERANKNPLFRFTLGIYLYEKGRIKSEDFNREYFSYRKTNPYNNPHLLLGKEEGDKLLDESIKYLRLALRSDPKNIEYIKALAWAYYIRRKLSYAYDTFQSVLKYDPFDIEVIFALKDLKERLK